MSEITGAAGAPEASGTASVATGRATDHPPATGVAAARTAFGELIDDLAAETAVVRDALVGLDAAGWDTPTPAVGWAVRDQISHLAYFDDTAALAVTDPERFRAAAAALMTRAGDFADDVAREHRTLPPDALLRWWERSRADLIAVYRDADPRQRTPWYGVEMSVMSSATARLMETWAHGVDVADALGRPLTGTARLRHVAHLGFRTAGFSFTQRGQDVPMAPIRVELAAPDGSTWTWGPADAADVVQGPALDFCLVVTQRRHLGDTAIEATGEVAGAWMAIAQAFAGPPTGGRPPQPESAQPKEPT